MFLNKASCLIVYLLFCFCFFCCFCFFFSFFSVQFAGITSVGVSTSVPTIVKGSTLFSMWVCGSVCGGVCVPDCVWESVRVSVCGSVRASVCVDVCVLLKSCQEAANVTDVSQLIAAAASPNCFSANIIRPPKTRPYSSPRRQSHEFLMSRCSRSSSSSSCRPHGRRQGQSQRQRETWLDLTRCDLTRLDFDMLQSARKHWHLLHSPAQPRPPAHTAPSPHSGPQSEVKCRASKWLAPNEFSIKFNWIFI